jgi:hypothetical protein
VTSRADSDNFWNVNRTVAHEVWSGARLLPSSLPSCKFRERKSLPRPFTSPRLACFLLGIESSSRFLQEHPMTNEMRLTQAQKRDLLRMSGAAVVSTIFFGVPMVVGRPDASRLQTTSAQVQSSRAQSAAPTVAVEQHDTDVSVVFSEAVAQVTVPELERAPTPVLREARAARMTRSTPAAVAPSAARSQPAPAGPALARRLGRLLAGSGRYEVRPFPTVGTSGN